MTTLKTDNQVIHFSKKFGLITENQLILTTGSRNKIRLDSIDRVNLIKRRVFFYNTLLFIISLSIILLTYLYFESERMEYYLCLGAFGVIVLVYSVIHKFYQYKIIIKEKDHSVVELKTTQRHRKSIKEFYSTIVRCMSSKK